MDAEGLIDWAERVLLDSEAIDHWQKERERIEAEELLAHVLGQDFDLEDDVPLAVQAKFEKSIARRAKGEPNQLIVGIAEFRGLDLIAKPGTFIPRDSSEFLAAEAIRRLKRKQLPVAVDMACGTGPVALAIANEVKGATVYGADLDPGSVRTARANARKLGLTVTFVRSDLFAGLPKRLRGSVDVVTLHPPYVARKEMEDLPDEIRLYEPVIVLTDGSDDGLGLVRGSAEQAKDWLKPGGVLLVEVSPDRARSVMSVLRKAGLTDVVSRKDKGFEVTRVITGRV
ncbi:MAG: HemK/PrmC family methyltransferase [Actinomycetota bacterium]